MVNGVDIGVKGVWCCLVFGLVSLWHRGKPYAVDLEMEWNLFHLNSLTFEVGGDDGCSCSSIQLYCASLATSKTTLLALVFFYISMLLVYWCQ